MIEKETIERIKTSVDIKDLVESKGICLKKNGKGWFGLCPFHNDKGKGDGFILAPTAG